MNVKNSFTIATVAAVTVSNIGFAAPQHAISKHGFVKGRVTNSISGRPRVASTKSKPRVPAPGAPVHLSFAGGVVRDADGNAFAGAVISYTPGPEVVTTTDESGRFMIKNVPGHRIRIYIETSLGHYTSATLICGIADNVIRISN